MLCILELAFEKVTYSKNVLGYKCRDEGLVNLEVKKVIGWIIETQFASMMVWFLVITLEI